MFKNCTVILVEHESLTQNAKISVNCFGACDAFIVTAYDDFASIDDVVKKSTCFMGGKEFLFTDCIFHLCVIEIV